MHMARQHYLIAQKGPIRKKNLEAITIKILNKKGLKITKSCFLAELTWLTSLNGGWTYSPFVLKGWGNSQP